MQAYNQLVEDTGSYKAEIHNLRLQHEYFIASTRSFQKSLDEKNLLIQEGEAREANYIEQLKEKDKTISKLDTRLKVGKYAIPSAFIVGTVLGILIVK